MLRRFLQKADTGERDFGSHPPDSFHLLCAIELLLQQPVRRQVLDRDMDRISHGRRAQPQDESRVVYFSTGAFDRRAFF